MLLRMRVLVRRVKITATVVLCGVGAFLLLIFTM
jgi:hypothetical protein